MVFKMAGRFVADVPVAGQGSRLRTVFVFGGVAVSIIETISGLSYIGSVSSPGLCMSNKHTVGSLPVLTVFSVNKVCQEESDCAKERRSKQANLSREFFFRFHRLLRRTIPKYSLQTFLQALPEASLRSY